MVPSTKKSRIKPSNEGKKEKKIRKERSLSPIPKERRSKRRLLKLSEASISPRADDEVSVIAADPINVVDTTTTPIAFTAKGITIREPKPERLSPKIIPIGNGKKKQKENK